jgi:rod shape-determining protein MreC
VRNLILILQTYQKFFFFLFLEIICLSVFIRNNNYQFQSYLNSARGVSGSLYSKKQRLTSYLNLTEKNKALQKENAQLKSKLGTKIEKNPLRDSSFSRSVITSTGTKSIYYNYKPARILNNSFDKKNNFITLNLGRKAGIKKNMIVLGPDGVVGKITHVSANYSLAASLLSKKFTVSAITPKGTISNVKWGGLRNPYHAVLSGISQSEKLKKGDSIVTSSHSKFPPNVMIGRVVKKMKGGSNSGGKYIIKLGTNFKKLQFVYIVMDEENVEIVELEDSVKAIENE